MNSAEAYEIACQLDEGGRNAVLGRLPDEGRCLQFHFRLVNWAIHPSAWLSVTLIKHGALTEHGEMVRRALLDLERSAADASV